MEKDIDLWMRGIGCMRRCTRVRENVRNSEDIIEILSDALAHSLSL